MLSIRTLSFPLLPHTCVLRFKFFEKRSVLRKGNDFSFSLPESDELRKRLEASHAPGSGADDPNDDLQSILTAVDIGDNSQPIPTVPDRPESEALVGEASTPMESGRETVVQSAGGQAATEPACASSSEPNAEHDLEVSGCERCEYFTPSPPENSVSSCRNSTFSPTL